LGGRRPRQRPGQGRGRIWTDMAGLVFKESTTRYHRRSLILPEFAGWRCANIFAPVARTTAQDRAWPRRPGRSCTHPRRPLTLRPGLSQAALAAYAGQSETLADRTAWLALQSCKRVERRQRRPADGSPAGGLGHGAPASRWRPMGTCSPILAERRPRQSIRPSPRRNREQNSVPGLDQTANLGYQFLVRSLLAYQ
jgi:hypothetical protein